MPRKSRSKYRPEAAVLERRARTRRKRMLQFGGLGALLVALAGFLIYQQMASRVPGEQRFPEQGFGTARHLTDANQPHPGYNSKPGTSGFHVGNNVAGWGIHSEPQPDELVVHNLEHGGIAFYYRQSLDQAAVQQLEELVNELQNRNDCVLLTPRADDQLNAPVVAAAWTYLLELQTVDRDLLTRFFEAHIGRGPEQECARTS